MRGTGLLVGVLVAGGLVMGPRASAQRLAPDFPTIVPRLASAWQTQQPVPSAPPHTEVPMFVGGAIGGAIGFFGGALVGLELAGGSAICGDDPCGLVGMIVGATVGEVIMLPLGVHVGNGKQGSYGAAFAASTAVAVGGLLLVGNTDIGEGAVVIPIGQIVAAMFAEKAARQR